MGIYDEYVREKEVCVTNGTNVQGDSYIGEGRIDEHAR